MNFHVERSLVTPEKVKRMFETKKKKKKMIMWLLWAQSENKIIGFASLAAPLFSSCYYKNISRRTPATVQTQASLESRPLLLAKRGGITCT